MKTTRLSFIAALALGGLAASATLCSAQTTNLTNSTQRAARRGASVQQRTDRMATELNLSEDQKTKVTALIQEQAKARQEIISNKDLSQDERRTKMRTLREGEPSKLKAILTPEQYAKWEKNMKEMRDRRRNSTPAPKPSTEPKTETKSQ